MTGPGTSGGTRGRSRFREWAELIGPEQRGFGGPITWLVATGIAFAAFGFATRVPALAAFFGLRIVPVAGLYLLALATALAVRAFEVRGGSSSVQRALGRVANNFSFQLALSATVAFSEPPGTFALAALPVLGACFKGLVLRPSPRYPFVAAAHGAAMATALALHPSGTHAVVFASVAPLALGGLVVSGFISAELASQGTALDQLRSAIRAQVLSGRGTEVERLARARSRATALRAEGGAALGEALRGAEALLARAQAEEPAGPDLEKLREDVAALREVLRRLAGAIQETRELGRELPIPAAELAAVPAFALAGEVALELAPRFPGVAISCRATSPQAELGSAAVGGGRASLHRILENLVVNACEGDGTRGARRVELTLSAEPEAGLLAIEVRDDGPGFPPALLELAIAPFTGTKPSGSGLGLYTVERLARASGGLLRRENPQQGGASVVVFLPVAPR